MSRLWAMTVLHNIGIAGRRGVSGCSPGVRPRGRIHKGTALHWCGAGGKGRLCAAGTWPLTRGENPRVSKEPWPGGRFATMAGTAPGERVLARPSILHAHSSVGAVTAAPACLAGAWRLGCAGRPCRRSEGVGRTHAKPLASSTDRHVSSERIVTLRMSPPSPPGGSTPTTQAMGDDSLYFRGGGHRGHPMAGCEIQRGPV